MDVRYALFIKYGMTVLYITPMIKLFVFNVRVLGQVHTCMSSASEFVVVFSS